MDVIGLNCSSGPKVMLETIEKMMRITTKPLSAMPNAGLPQRRWKGRNIYLCSPEYMAQYARRISVAGVQIVGGCCGTTPEHIKEIRREARRCSRVQKTLSVTVEEPRSKAHALRERAGGAKDRKLGAKLAAGKFVAFVEILPPRGVDASQGNRRREAVHGSRHRLHQRAGRPARQRPHERAGHLPVDPAAGRNRSGDPFLLPRPQYSEHPDRTAGRAHGRASAI